MFRKIMLLFFLTLGFAFVCEAISFAALNARNPRLAQQVEHEHVALRYVLTPIPTPQNVNKKSEPIPLHALYGWHYNAPAKFSGLAVDSQGFVLNRAGDSSAIDPTADVRVVMIGGSTVAGSGATANTQTIAAQLEALLEWRTGYNFNVVNGGTGGWYSANELAFLTQEVLPFHAPDVVIVLDGYNDMWRATVAAQQFTERDDGSWTTNRSDYLYDMTLQDNQTKLTQPPNEVKRGVNWHLLFSTTLLFASDEVIPTPAPPYPPTLDSLDGIDCPDVPLTLHPYISNIRSMIGAARANDTAVVYALQPVIVYKKQLTQPEAVARNQMRYIVMQGDLAAYGVPAGTCLDTMQQDYFDMARPEVAALIASNDDPQVAMLDLSALFADNPSTLFYDYAHYRDAGNHRIALALVNPVLEVLKASDK